MKKKHYLHRFYLYCYWVVGQFLRRQGRSQLITLSVYVTLILLWTLFVTTVDQI